LVAEELEAAPVKHVRAALGRQVDDAAIEPAEFGGRAVSFDLELLNRVDHRVDGDPARLPLQHRYPSEQIRVGARRAAVDAGKLRIRWKGDAWGKRGQADKGAAVQRQLNDLLVLDDVAEARGDGPQHRRIRGDGDLLADGADGKIDV